MSRKRNLRNEVNIKKEVSVQSMSSENNSTDYPVVKKENVLPDDECNYNEKDPYSLDFIKQEAFVLQMNGSTHTQTDAFITNDTRRQNRIILPQTMLREVRQKNTERVRRLRESMTDEEKRIMRQKEAERVRMKRLTLSEEERQLIRQKQAERVRLKRQSMTEEEHRIHCLREAERAREKRRTMSEEEHRRVCHREAERARVRRLTLTEEEKRIICQRQAERARMKRQKIANEELKISSDLVNPRKRQVSRRSGKMESISVDDDIDELMNTEIRWHYGLPETEEEARNRRIADAAKKALRRKRLLEARAATEDFDFNIKLEIDEDSS